MSNQDESNEYLCLKLLLDKWKLAHLLQHFVAQKINVEILKIMKPRHINEAVSCFPLGDRIRFEYELEKWRHGMGLPLLEENKIKTEVPTNPTIDALNIFEKILEKFERNQNSQANQSKTTNANESTQQQQASIPTLEINAKEQTTLTTATASLMPATTSSCKSTNTTPPPPLAPPPTVPAITLRKLSATTPPQEAPFVTTRNLRASKRARSAKKRANMIFKPPRELIAIEGPHSINAKSILLQCKPRGQQLMDIYEARGTFTNSERTELINLFAKFFYQNGIHLSLKISYVLENQILKLFPGERLKDYRTEKRGRIYIRLGNIKNLHTRNEKAKMRQELDSLHEQFVITNMDENDEATSYMPDEDEELHAVAEEAMDESNSVDQQIFADGIKTDELESDAAEHSVFGQVTMLVKAEKEDNGLFATEAVVDNQDYIE